MFKPRLKKTLLMLKVVLACSTSAFAQQEEIQVIPSLSDLKLKMVVPATVRSGAPIPVKLWVVNDSDALFKGEYGGCATEYDIFDKWNRLVERFPPKNTVCETFSQPFAVAASSKMFLLKEDLYLRNGPLPKGRYTIKVTFFSSGQLGTLQATKLRSVQTPLIIR